MDPIAHTLVGATLAESGLKRAGPLATATLLLGANAPDLDALTGAGGSDSSLYWRRGLSHGVLAMVILPLLLTAVMLAWDRWVRRRRDPDAVPARAGPLLLLSTISILTHPALDWLNTYGVRLLMPFDGAWFYGDAIFIVDPWMWLLMAAAVVLARSRGRLSSTAWIVLGLAATALVGLVGMVPIGAKVAWAVGVAAIVVLRQSGLAREHTERVAVICLSVLLIYVGGMMVGSRLALGQAQAWLRDHGTEGRAVMAAPVPANPFVRDVIVQSDDGYRFLRVDWLAEPPVGFGAPFEPRGEVTPIVERALASPALRGTRNWVRFPVYEVRPEGDGHRVVVRDVRYSRRGESGFGTASVYVEAPRDTHIDLQ